MVILIPCFSFQLSPDLTQETIGTLEFVKSLYGCFFGDNIWKSNWIFIFPCEYRSIIYNEKHNNYSNIHYVKQMFQMLNQNIKEVSISCSNQVVEMLVKLNRIIQGKIMARILTFLWDVPPVQNLTTSINFSHPLICGFLFSII